MARARRTARPHGVRRATADGSPVRARLMLLGAVVISAVVLFAWFPAGSLLSQRSSLAANEAQLAALHKQDAALAQEKKNLSAAGEIGRIAREQYQLVAPGQQAYQVLPPSGAAARTPYAGDPGSAGPVTPSATPELPPGGVSTTTTPAAASRGATSGNTQSGSGFLSRMVHSLEFWR